MQFVRNHGQVFLSFYNKIVLNSIKEAGLSQRRNPLMIISFGTYLSCFLHIKSFSVIYIRLILIRHLFGYDNNNNTSLVTTITIICYWELNFFACFSTSRRLLMITGDSVTKYLYSTRGQSSF